MRSASSSDTTAPELLAAGVRAGIDIGSTPDGRIYAQVTNKRSRKQRDVFEAMTDNMLVPAVLLGFYYPGDWRRVQ